MKYEFFKHFEAGQDMSEIIYSYDHQTGHTMSLDKCGNFRYEGVNIYPPDGALISTDRTAELLAGCLGLSSWDRYNLVLISDGKTEQMYLAGSFCGSFQFTLVLDNPPDLAICVCGDIVKSPEKMMKLCKRFPCSRMYACPIVEELVSFGVFARKTGGVLHRRISMAWENKKIWKADSREFDPKLDGDGMGRMADLVSHDLFPVNEFKSSIGVSPFYGKTLHRDWKEGSICIVRIVDMDRLFPTVPISAKNYIATSVPVRMETTQQFRDETGYNGEYVDVFVSTDYIPDVAIFMRFYKTLSGRSFVWASEQDRVQHKAIVPVFQNDRAYRVKRENYEQAIGSV